MLNNNGLHVRHAQGEDIHLIWLPGFMSTCYGEKADSIFELANQAGYRFTSFDYSGHGKSEGNMAFAKISTWLEEIEQTLDIYAKGKVILIGSSMGGWLALNKALHSLHSHLSLIHI